MSDKKKNDSAIPPVGCLLYVGLPILIFAIIQANLNNSSVVNFLQLNIPNIFSNLIPFILVIITIPPIIWVISVSFLGRAIEIAKKKEAESKDKERGLVLEKHKEAQANLETASKEGMAKAQQCLDDFETQQKTIEKEREEINNKYNILRLHRSIGAPSFLFILTLIIIWLNPIYNSSATILSTALCVVILLVGRGIYQIYKVMEVIQEVAKPAEETFVASLKSALNEIAESKKPILELLFKSKQPPFKTTTLSPFVIEIGIYLSKGDVANKCNIMFHAPQGFDFADPNTAKCSQDDSFEIPKAISIGIRISDVLKGINQLLHIAIIAPNTPGEYILGYNLNCEGFSGKLEKFKVIVEAPVFKVVKATYGINNNVIDVTAKLSSLVRNDRLLIPGGSGTSNKVAGRDPAIGQTKEWNITYKINNEEKNVKLIENEKIELPQ